MKLFHKYVEGDEVQIGINFTSEHDNSIFILVIIIPFFFPIFRTYKSYEYLSIMQGYQVPVVGIRLRLRTTFFEKRWLFKICSWWKDCGKQEIQQYDTEALEKRW